MSHACLVARADPGGARLALDLEYAIPINEDSDLIGSGPGGAVRAGYELDAGLLSLTPELAGSYHSLGGDASPSVVRGSAGLRLSFLKVVEPGVFGHIGVAHTSLDLPVADDPSWTELTYDVGVTLDLTLLPLLELGLHAGYTYVAPEVSAADGLDWAAVGVHGTLAF
jgi:hypothetical protein